MQFTVTRSAVFVATVVSLSAARGNEVTDLLEVTEWHAAQVEESRYSTLQHRAVFSLGASDPNDAAGMATKPFSLFTMEKEDGRWLKYFLVGTCSLERDRDTSIVKAVINKAYTSSSDDDPRASWTAIQTLPISRVELKLSLEHLDACRLDASVTDIQQDGEAFEPGFLHWWDTASSVEFTTFPYNGTWIDEDRPPGFDWKRPTDKFSNADDPPVVLKGPTLRDFRSDLRFVAGELGEDEVSEAFDLFVAVYRSLIDDNRPFGGYALMPTKYVSLPSPVGLIPLKSESQARRTLEAAIETSGGAKHEGVYRLRLAEEVEVLCAIQNAYAYVSRDELALLSKLPDPIALLQREDDEPDVSLEVVFDRIPSNYREFALHLIDRGMRTSLGSEEGIAFLMSDFFAREATRTHKEIFETLDAFRISADVDAGRSQLELDFAFVFKQSAEPDGVAPNATESYSTSLGTLRNRAIFSAFLVSPPTGEGPPSSVDELLGEIAPLADFLAWGVPDRMRPFIRRLAKLVIKHDDAPLDVGAFYRLLKDDETAAAWLVVARGEFWEDMDRVMRDEFHAMSEDTGGRHDAIQTVRGTTIRTTDFAGNQVHIAVHPQAGFLSWGPRGVEAIKDALREFDPTSSCDISPLRLEYTPVVHQLFTERGRLKQTKDESDSPLSVFPSLTRVGERSAKRIEMLEKAFPGGSSSSAQVTFLVYDKPCEMHWTLRVDAALLKLLPILNAKPD